MSFQLPYYALFLNPSYFIVENCTSPSKSVQCPFTTTVMKREGTKNGNHQKLTSSVLINNNLARTPDTKVKFYINTIGDLNNQTSAPLLIYSVLLNPAWNSRLKLLVWPPTSAVKSVLRLINISMIRCHYTPLYFQGKTTRSCRRPGDELSQLTYQNRTAADEGGIECNKQKLTEKQKKTRRLC